MLALNPEGGAGLEGLGTLGSPLLGGGGGRVLITEGAGALCGVKPVKYRNKLCLQILNVLVQLKPLFASSMKKNSLILMSFLRLFCRI